MESELADAPRIFELPVHKIHTQVLRTLARLLKRPIESLTGLLAADDIYARAWKMPKDIPFCDRVLQSVGVRTLFSDEELSHVPKEGAVVVVSNHPFGGIEGVILLSLLRRVRPDVKAMANYLLEAIPEMRSDFIFVDPFGAKNSAKVNMRPIKESLSWLKEGHLLIVFPSGEVSSFDRKTLRVRDPAWSASIAALVRKTSATVVPMFFPGRNNFAFIALGFIHPRLRTLQLPRQIANKKGKRLSVRIGTPLTTKALEPFSTDDVQLIKYLRFRSYLLEERETHRTRRFRGQRRSNADGEPLPFFVGNLARQLQGAQPGVDEAEGDKGEVVASGEKHGDHGRAGFAHKRGDAGAPGRVAHAQSLAVETGDLS
jgi:putative hemolysin